MAKYDIDVELSGQDGNAFSILARITRAMKRAKVDKKEIAAFTKEAQSGDYHNLLNVCADWVNVS